MMTPDDKGIQQARREVKILSWGILGALCLFTIWRHYA